VLRMTYEQACSVLGVPLTAREAEIKAAHRRLVKKFHPDNGQSGNEKAYELVQAAYECLSARPAEVPVFPKPSKKVVGGAAGGKKSYGYQSKKERERFEKNYVKQQAEKKERFERKVEQFKIKEEEKKNEAIYVERAAEILRMMLEQE